MNAVFGTVRVLPDSDSPSGSILLTVPWFPKDRADASDNVSTSHGDSSPFTFRIEITDVPRLGHQDVKNEILTVVHVRVSKVGGSIHRGT